MGKEIERKFLVKGNEWRDGNKAVHTCQGYLASGSDCTVRIRLQETKAFLTIKGKAMVYNYSKVGTVEMIESLSTLRPPHFLP